MLNWFSNPHRFEQLERGLSPILWCLTLIGFAIGLPWALLFSPPDYQQSETVRIMYVHVPSAWMGLFAYACLAGASFIYFVWRHTLADLAAQAIAPCGAVFTALCLITGSLWGKPMWGAWWVWDGRLTSMLILLLLYLGYLALRAGLENQRATPRLAAILAMAGVVNLPIIKFSVDWWNSLHQPASVMRLDGPTLSPEILMPLLVMALSFTLLFISLVLFQMRTSILAQRADRLERKQEQRLEAGPGL